MAMNPLSIVGGGLLLFFLPGFFLLHALFPGRRYFGPFHSFALPIISVVTSVALVIVVGTFLAFVPGAPPGSAPERGWFQGHQTGAPVLEVVFGSLVALFFLIGWGRGAFPLIGPRATYEDPIERGEPAEFTLLRDLRLEEERLRKEARRIRKRATTSRDAGVRTALSEAADDLERDRASVRAKAIAAEKQAGERRYGDVP